MYDFQACSTPLESPTHSPTPLPPPSLSPSLFLSFCLSLTHTHTHREGRGIGKKGKVQSKKTKVVKKTLDPSWDERFSFDAPAVSEGEGGDAGDAGAAGVTDDATDVDVSVLVTVTVMDHDRFGSNDFMGQVDSEE